MKLNLFAMRIRIVLLCLIFSQFTFQTTAQTTPAIKSDTSVTKPTKGDGIRPIQEVLPAGTKTSVSFFKVHEVADRFYFELPDSILNRDLLVVNRISKSPADLPKNMLFPSYAGDEIGENVIQFERIRGNKIVLKVISFKDRSSDTSENGLSRSLINSGFQSYQAAFPIKAFSNKKDASVIDVTDYLNGDNTVFFFNEFFKRILPFTAVIPDRSFIDAIKAYPINVEIATIKTYNTKPYPNGMTIPPLTFRLNSSVLLLPQIPMKARVYDSRVGYINTTYTNFDVNPQGVENTGIISRWKLEPKPGDLEKYKRGELVEPQKPIIIYIDPATPKKWVPYLIDGINDWQVAFEKAGFKNAIIGKETPNNDSTWSLEDARHSFVVYKPSDVANATGPSIIDPRSGEIIETHINWYHNVMDLLYKWYFIQAGPLDPKAQKPQFDDSLMGQLIRFVSSHEVGHTLGLHHNFGASSTVPVDSLRSKAWVEAHGHTPSIMDYARFNYVAQPEDHISEKGIFPRIGDYDKWAIEWGYRLLPSGITPEDEKKTLNEWILRKLAEGKQYYFGKQGDPLDPRNQNEDLGDDAMKAGNYGIKNLKRIMPNLVKWTSLPDESYTKAGEMYEALLGQYNRYVLHVVKNIGGMMTTPKSVEEKGGMFEFTPKEKQKRAVQFLGEQLFAPPRWLLNERLFSLTGKGDYESIGKIQKAVLSDLLSGSKLNYLLSVQMIIGDKAYSPEELLTDLKKNVFSEIYNQQDITAERRNLQKMFVELLVNLIPNDLTTQRGSVGRETDAITIVKGFAKSLVADIKTAAIRSGQQKTKSHLQEIADRLSLSLYPKRN